MNIWHGSVRRISSKRIGCCFSQQPILFTFLPFFTAVFTQAQLSACIGFQFLGRIKQPDGNGSHLCLLAPAINMHGICFAVDYKVADWQRAFLPFRTIINYFVLYFLLFYNIKSIFVNANPIQERHETLRIFGHSCTTKNLPAKPTGFYLHPSFRDLYFFALRCRSSSSICAS